MPTPKQKNDRHSFVNWNIIGLPEDRKTELVFVLMNTRTPSDMDKGAVMPY